VPAGPSHPTCVLSDHGDERQSCRLVDVTRQTWSARGVRGWVLGVKGAARVRGRREKRVGRCIVMVGDGEWGNGMRMSRGRVEKRWAVELYIIRCD
jgi:hypothetical protein